MKKLILIAIGLFVIGQLSFCQVDTQEFWKGTNPIVTLSTYPPQNGGVLIWDGTDWKIKPQSQSDSIKIPKSLIVEIAKFAPTTTVSQTITNPVDLSTVRTAGLHAFSIESGGLGRRLLLNLQNSPYDEDYYLKGIRVDPAFVAELKVNAFGEQILVFKKK